MVLVNPNHDHTPADSIEATPEMVWAGLEEWSGFDEARDELTNFLVRLYRVMEATRRNAKTLRLPPVEISGRHSRR